MILGGYQVKAQLGAGPDGASYLATRPGSNQVFELRSLERSARNPSRWAWLRERLEKVALLDDPTLLQIAARDLDSSSPWIALLRNEGSPLSEVIKQKPVDEDTTWALTLALARGLRELHRFGLFHGELCPSAIQMVDGAPVIDVCGTETMPPPYLSWDSADRTALAREHKDGLTCVESDVFGVAQIALFCIRGGAAAKGEPLRIAEPISRFLDSMRSGPPEMRPTSAEVVHFFSSIAETGQEDTLPVDGALQKDTVPDSAAAASVAHRESVPEPVTAGSTLGPYKLLACIGKGGMGEVYRAESLVDGTTVAIKVLTPEALGSEEAMKRFRREARVMARVRSPYVANLLDANEDRGVFYMALEFVAGMSLDDLLEKEGHLGEAESVEIVSDISRALTEAHRRGIVHRDIKPANVIIAAPLNEEQRSSYSGRVKVVDFGIAHHVEGTEALKLTTDGSPIGTPAYMAPEQCMGKDVSPSADIYSTGATLFHLTTGQPPFTGDSIVAVLIQHLNDSPVPAREINGSVSSGLSDLVGQTLKKDPRQRFKDGKALETALAELTGKMPNLAVEHPAVPPHEPGSLRAFQFAWRMESSPDKLWPFVSNTDRVNRAAGMAPVEYTAQYSDNKPTSYLAESRAAGLNIAWAEEPFEWIAGKRFAVLRRFVKGPIEWYVSDLRLNPLPGSGTELTQTITVCPRNIFGRMVAALQIGRSLKRKLDIVYPRIDALLQGNSQDGNPFDPFGGGPKQKPNSDLDTKLVELRERGIPADVTAMLGKYIRSAGPQQLARIQPIALAKKLGLSPQSVIEACLHGTKIGLFEMLWDLLCPSCRIPSQIRESLRALGEHGHCVACNLDYQFDFDNAVEMVFRITPQIQQTELRTYCIGNPGGSPHVAAQVRLEPGELLRIELRLGAGHYLIRSAQLSNSHFFEVERNGGAVRLDLTISESSLGHNLPVSLVDGQQTVTLSNTTGHTLLLRIEREMDRRDALTASRAGAMEAFRELFPDEVLEADQQLPVDSITLLVCDWDQTGGQTEKSATDNVAKAMWQAVQSNNGAVVRALDSGFQAAFSRTMDALLCARVIADIGAKSDSPVPISRTIHEGPVRMATEGGKLDYFGATVTRVHLLAQTALGGELLISRRIAEKHEVANLMKGLGLTGQWRAVELEPGVKDWVVAFP